jgi:hypothetical protein
LEDRNYEHFLKVPRFLVLKSTLFSGARMQHRLVSRNSMRARTSKAFFAQGLFETAVDVTHHSFSAALLCSSSTVELLATVLQLLEHTKKDNDECVLVGG